MIETKELSFQYGAVQILREVTMKAGSMETGAKCFTGIIGPNGSGKSTLLKCIYRVLKPSAGAVYLNGENLGKLSVKQSAREMAVVAQHNNYNFDFSVQQVVLMGRSPHKRMLERDTKEDYAIAAQALHTVGMEEFAHRTFSTLSGGEQQRVILARALAQQAPCLILDEPTNHLDITYQLELLKIVKRLDVTVVAAIHDLNLAAAFCDRIYAVQEGRIAADGTPAQVLTPKFIRQLYHVDSEIVWDSRGKMHILFT